tara:strand:- start:4103 stop:4723 length:621 start_codon:yes stop_codon:yes gene_type:complete
MALGVITRLAGRLLGPKALRALGGAKGLQGIAGEAALSGAINTGANLAFGMDPMEALAYGGADALASGASIGLVRGLRPKGYRTVTQRGKDGQKVTSRERVRSRLETPVNVAASVASSIPVMALTGGMSPQGIQGSQQAQILQQQTQRAAVNNDAQLLAGAYMPYTNFQNLGMPSRNAMLEQAMNDSGLGFDMAGYEKGMQQILGL